LPSYDQARDNQNEAIHVSSEIIARSIVLDDNFEDTGFVCAQEQWK